MPAAGIACMSAMQITVILYFKQRRRQRLQAVLNFCF